MINEREKMGYCCVGCLPYEKEVVLSYKRAELLYDAKNYAYVEGEVLDTDNVHVRHQVIDIGDRGNVDRVTRVLALSHAECVEMLYPYSKDPLEGDARALDDVLVPLDEYLIRLRLPETFSLTTVQLVHNMVHEYMVCRVLADWMSITNPASASKWEEKYKQMREKIQTSLVSRTGRVRRKCKPF